MLYLVKKITDYCACAIANYPKSLNEYQKIKLLKGRLDRVVSDYQDLFNESINLDKNLQIDDRLTYAEILLNKFVYENKCLISKLKEQLDLIANSEIKDKNKQQEIIDNLMKIKKYYNIFYNYGRNLLVTTFREHWFLFQCWFLFLYCYCVYNFSSNFDRVSFRRN